MVKKILLSCGVVSSVLYVAGDILASLRYEGYSYADQQVSELLADGSPVRPLMLGLNGIPYAALAAAFGVGVWTVAGPRRAARAAGALLIGYAVASLAGAVLFRMNTRAVLAAGEGDWRGSLHLPVTAVLSLFLMTAMGFGAALFGRGFRWYTVGTFLVMLAAGGLVATQAGAIAENEATPWMGIAERVNIYASMLWVAALAGGLLRAHQIITPRRLSRPTVSPRLLPR